MWHSGHSAFATEMRRKRLRATRCCGVKIGPDSLELRLPKYAQRKRGAGFSKEKIPNQRYSKPN